jgi:ceramide glucosyltransferase
MSSEEGRKGWWEGGWTRVGLVIGDLSVALSGLSQLYGLLALAVLVNWRRTRQHAPRLTPPPEGVTLFKPLAGYEPGLPANLETFGVQDYGGPVQLVLGVATPTDPAAPLALEFASRHPDWDVAVSTRQVRLGRNPKINNVAGMVPLARYGIWVLSDADIAVPPGYLRELCGILADPEVGAVTCLYRGKPGDGSPYSHMLAAYINACFLPSVLVSLIGRRHAYGLGATLAFHRDTLAGLGGLQAVADDLADDFALARLIEQTGRRVVLASVVVTTITAEPTLGSLLGHLRRWSYTSRTARPWGYAFSFLSYPISLACIAVAVTVSVPAIALLGLAVSVRCLMHVIVDDGLSRYAWPVRVLLVVGSEWAAFVGWLTAFLPTPIRWRQVTWPTHGARGPVAGRRIRG